MPAYTYFYMQKDLIVNILIVWNLAWLLSAKPQPLFKMSMKSVGLCIIGGQTGTLQHKRLVLTFGLELSLAVVSALLYPILPLLILLPHDATLVLAQSGVEVVGNPVLKHPPPQ